MRNKKFILIGLWGAMAFSFGVILGYKVAFNKFATAIEGQALIDISRQLAIVQKFRNNPDFNLIKSEIDLNIHRHLLQVVFKDGLSCDDQNDMYKKSVIDKLNFYWQEFPPFDDLISDLASGGDLDAIDSLEKVRRSVRLWKSGC